MCSSKTLRFTPAIVIALLLAAEPAFATEMSREGAAPERWAGLADTVFRHLGRDSEFTSAAVPTALAQDGDGFLWVGSQDGLTRWDGYHTRTYRSDPAASDALPDNFIKTLHVDTRGRLWIGTSSGGLARYDRDRDRFITYAAGPSGLSHVSVRAIADDGVGGVWIATEGGLDHLNPESGSITHLRHDDADSDSLPDNRVRAMLRDRSGTLWIGTPKGLVRRDVNTTRFVPVSLPVRGGAHPSAWSFFEDSAGRIWIGTVRDGAYIVEPGEHTARLVRENGPEQSELQTQGVHAFVEVRPGEVWLGTMGLGLVAIDPASQSTRRIRHDPTLPSSLADNTVQALLKDRAGLIWVCTNRAISVYDPSQVVALTVFGASSRKESISDADIDAVLQMPDGRIWLGLGTNGVDILDPDSVRVGGLRPDPKRPRHALPADYINAFAPSPTGAVYLGTEQGLYRVDPAANNVVRIPVPQRDSNAAIWSLLLVDDVVWFGGFDGLWGIKARDDATPVLVRPGSEAGLTDARVTVIEPGPDPSLWVGTKNGLNRFNRVSHTIERILPDPRDSAALAAGYVTTLLTDTQGRLWVGTLGGGISILQTRDPGGRARFHRLGVAQGLTNNNINKLLQDREGRVWASTDDGLAVIDPKTFAVRTLRRAEGVPIPSYWVGSGAVTARGELLFGGTGGLTIVRPERLTQWRYDPPIVISDVRIQGKPVPANRFNGKGSGAPLTIAHATDSITVEFSALDFSAPERNRYAFRLDGFDADWVESEPARRLASYTNLPPGDYTLHLRGTNRDGAWSPKESTLPIRVLPAWYQTIWLRIAAAVIAIALVSLLVQARTAYHRRRQRELEQQVIERTAALLETQSHLEQIAYLDTLTRLPNRRMFTEELRKLATAARSRNEHFSLLLIDLDRFKQINDTFGHDAGDAVLVETANRLRVAVRKSDCVTRLGGDEFAVLVAQNPSAAEIEVVCQRIVDAFGVEIPLACATLKISVSVGAALFPSHSTTEDGLYKASDLALYAAKRAGRSSWRWYRSVDAQRRLADECRAG